MVDSYIKQRISNKDLYDQALENGYTEIQALIISNRSLPVGTDLLGFKNPKISEDRKSVV